MQFGYVTVVKSEGDVSVIICFYDKVGRYLLHASVYRFTERSTGFRIQFTQFIGQDFSLQVGYIKMLLYLIPPFLCEFLEILAYNLKHEFFGFRIFTAFDLQQQTFLQGTGAYARRVESVQYMQRIFYFLFRSVDIIIDGQFVADISEVLSEQSVIIE